MREEAFINLSDWIQNKTFTGIKMAAAGFFVRGINFRHEQMIAYAFYNSQSFIEMLYLPLGRTKIRMFPLHQGQNRKRITNSVGEQQWYTGLQKEGKNRKPCRIRSGTRIEHYKGGVPPTPGCLAAGSIGYVAQLLIPVIFPNGCEPLRKGWSSGGGNVICVSQYAPIDLTCLTHSNSLIPHAVPSKNRIPNPGCFYRLAVISSDRMGLV